MRVVLDDNLYAEYYKFKHPELSTKKAKSSILSKILRFAGDDVLTNIRQLDEIDKRGDLKVDKAGNKYSTLAKKSDQMALSVEELAKRSEYKIVLTKEKGKDFPFVNIDDDEIEMALGGFLMKGATRKKAIAHLKELCSGAKKLTIYDSYLKISDMATLSEILPAAPGVTLVYKKNKKVDQLDQGCREELGRLCPNITIEPQDLKDHHDRYIIIDNRIEVILTSGVERLREYSDKEISYIIHPYRDRF